MLMALCPVKAYVYSPETLLAHFESAVLALEGEDQIEHLAALSFLKVARDLNGTIEARVDLKDGTAADFLSHAESGNLRLVVPTPAEVDTASTAAVTTNQRTYQPQPA